LTGSISCTNPSYTRTSIVAGALFKSTLHITTNKKWFDDICIDPTIRNYEKDRKLVNIRERGQARNFESRMWDEYGLAINPQKFYVRKSINTLVDDARILNATAERRYQPMEGRGVRPPLGWSQLSPGFIVPNTFIARQNLMHACGARDNKFSRLATGFTQSLVAQRFMAERELQKKGLTTW